MPETPPTLKTLSPVIDGMLRQLRSQIRRAILLEGVAWCVVAAIGLFWCSLAIDYGPVRWGYSEMPLSVRAGLLVVTGLVITVLGYRLVLRRIFVRLSDSSLALLVERKYPEFADALVTTVNRTEPRAANSADVPVNADMLARTLEQAEEKSKSVELASIIQSRVVKRAMIGALIGVLSMVALAIGSFDTLKIAGARLYQLSSVPWPRACQIELVGVLVKRANPVPGIVELEETLAPQAGVITIAKGASLTMVVRAKASQEFDHPESGNKSVPETCWLNYRTDEGTRGSQPFKRIGSPREGYQTYRLDGAPLENLLSGLDFHIAGGDDRTDTYQLNVVDEPTVRVTDLACKFPDYLESLRFTDRKIRWTGNAKLPVGTGLTIESQTTTPLQKIYVRVNQGGDSDSEPKDVPLQMIPVGGSTFRIPLSPLQALTTVDVYLVDKFNIVPELPFQVVINPIQDQAPLVTTTLRGIGTAVTPDVRLPIEGVIEDDYGVAKNWVELEIGGANPIQEPVELDDQGRFSVAIDFRKRRTELGDAYRLIEGVNEQLSFTVASEDRFNLGEQPNRGTGDRFTLDVVSSDELLRILERLEVDQRRRLEQVLRELKETRKFLQRTQVSNTNFGQMEPGDEPGDGMPAETSSSKKKAEQARELRRLFAQRALLQIDKSRLEILGSAAAFEDLRLQIINNRIVGTNRESRFERQIIGPLSSLGQQTMEKLKAKVVKLESELEEVERINAEAVVAQGGSVSAEEREALENVSRLSTNDAIEQVEVAIQELDEILSLLLKFETQNELLDIVRRMIADQKALLERTKKQRQKEAFEGLLD